MTGRVRGAPAVRSDPSCRAKHSSPEAPASSAATSAELLLDHGTEVWALDDLSTGSLANVEHLRDRSDFHLVIDSVLSRTVVNELVNRCRRRLSPRRGRRASADRRAARAHNRDQPRGFGDRARPLRTASAGACSRLHVRDLRRPPDAGSAREDARRVYGPTTQRRWLYADSKAMDEFLALAYLQSARSTAWSPVFSTPSGPARAASTAWSCRRFVQRALADEPLEIHGDGTQTTRSATCRTRSGRCTG